jgi:hypothetical protein
MPIKVMEKGAADICPQKGAVNTGDTGGLPARTNENKRDYE